MDALEIIFGSGGKENIVDCLNRIFLSWNGITSRLLVRGSQSIYLAKVMATDFKDLF